MEPDPRDLQMFRSISERIARLREETGKSQEEVAHLAGLNASYIAHIETEPRQPTLMALRRIAEYGLDMPVWRLLVDDRLEPDESARDAATRELNRAVHGLSPTHLKLLVELADQLRAAPRAVARTSTHKRKR